MTVHRTSVAAAAATVALLALTGCASGTSAPASTSAAAKTYTASDLPRILKTAKQQLGVSGTIQGNAKVQAELQKLGSGGALSKLLSAPGASITPATCKDMLSTALSVAPPSKTIASILTFGDMAATVAAEPGKQLPTSVSTGATQREDKFLAACSSMKLTVAAGGQSQSIDIAVKKAALHTHAQRTSAIVEQIQIPTSGGSSKPVSVEVVSAVQGNLLITVESASTTTTAAATTGSPTASSGTPSLAKVVNAIVSASK